MMPSRTLPTRVGEERAERSGVEIGIDQALRGKVDRVGLTGTKSGKAARKADCRVARERQTHRLEGRGSAP